MSLKLRARNHPNLQGCFSVMPLISPDLGSQNVLKTYKTAISHNRRTTRTILERFFCRWIYFYLGSKIFLSLTRVGAIAPIDCPPMDPPVIKDRYGSFHLWMNVSMKGETVWSLVNASHSFTSLHFIYLPRSSNKACMYRMLYLQQSGRVQQCAKCTNNCPVKTCEIKMK